jgi:hypothetical protein
LFFFADPGFEGIEEGQIANPIRRKHTRNSPSGAGCVISVGLAENRETSKISQYQQQQPRLRRGAASRLRRGAAFRAAAACVAMCSIFSDFQI